MALPSHTFSTVYDFFTLRLTIEVQETDGQHWLSRLWVLLKPNQQSRGYAKAVLLKSSQFRL